MAVHVLKNQRNDFYWITVKRGIGKFEVIARSTEGYTQKHNALDSIQSEASLLSSIPAYTIVDHTLQNKTKVYSKFGLLKTPSFGISAELQREIDWVIEQHPFQNLNA